MHERSVKSTVAAAVFTAASSSYDALPDDGARRRCLPPLRVDAGPASRRPGAGAGRSARYFVGPVCARGARNARRGCSGAAVTRSRGVIANGL